MDYMLVKSKVVAHHMYHLRQMFSILRRYQMMLNNLKCTFEVGSGKFLVFMVNQREIEANLEKIKPLLDMSLPRKPNK